MQLLLETQDPSAAEDGYLCGLLHNLGTIVLHNTHPERYQRVIARVVIGPDAWPDVEQELFGVRSITLLPRLLDGWHLPERVVRLLRDLAHDESEVVRGFVAVNFFVPADVMAELADDPSEVVRGLVAWKASLQREGELVVQGG